MSARKRTFSGSKSTPGAKSTLGSKNTPGSKSTPITSKPFAVPNTKKLTNENSNVTIAEPVVVDPSHSQKYMQHKFDMAYNKYLHNLALESNLNKTHKEVALSYDTQLTNYEEMHETAVDELQGQKELVSEITTAIQHEHNTRFLESALDDIRNLMNENQILQNTEKINENLQLICDNLNFENITFESTNENYTKLQNILKEILKLLQEINEGNNEEFNIFVENILKVKHLITKLSKNHEEVNNRLVKLNKLVLKTASIELSKTDENKLCTSITSM